MEAVSSIFGFSGNYTPSTKLAENDAKGKEASKTEKSSNDTSANELSDKEKQQVKELKKRENEVRAHEMAHIAAGGGLVRGGASYDYSIGPDGRRYITGGEVKIDMSPVPGDPEATIRKMQQVRSAALAPADPSPQDRSVAMKATQTEMKARAELAEERSEKMSETINDIDTGNKSTQVSSANNFLIEAYRSNTEQQSIFDKAG
ncbi:MAG: putative metalloprotease CJM1_0395 family protein [Bacteroidota bacterium]